MLIGTVWHVISAIVIGPALIILHKFPNRGGSKRVRILSNLLFWLLLNSLMAAVYKLGVIGGVFLPGNDYDEQAPPSAQVSIMMANNNNNFSRSLSASSTVPTSMKLTSALAGQRQQLLATDPVIRQARSLRAEQITAWSEKLARAKLHYGQLTQSPSITLAHQNHSAIADGYNASQTDASHLSKKAAKRLKPVGGGSSKQDIEESLLLTPHKVASPTSGSYDANKDAGEAGKQLHYMVDGNRDARSTIGVDRIQVAGSSALHKKSQQQQHKTGVQLDDKRPKLSMAISKATTEPSSSTAALQESTYRCKRSATDPGRGASQPAPVVFVCWLLSLGIRIVSVCLL